MSNILRFSFENTSTEKVFEWLKKKIQKGYYPQYSQYSDEQLLALANYCQPYISIQLSTARRLGILQLEERKRKASSNKQKGGAK